MGFRLCLALMLAAGFAVAGESEEKADLVLRHGRVYTMDAARSWAEAIAIKSGRIVYVGDGTMADRWIGPGTQVIDLAGRFVMPSFIDSHVHPVSAGVEMDQCVLTDKDSKEEVLSAIKAYAESHADAKWIIGNNWQLPVFPDANPRKEWLDVIIRDRPVLLTSADGHSVWVNSRALTLAGITRATKDPENGRIERDANGEPTGTLRESAAELVSDLAPRPTPEDRVAAVARAVEWMNRLGITSFHDASVVEPELQAYTEAEKRGLLTARVMAALYADPKQDDTQIVRLEELRRRYTTPRVRPSSAKIFADGVIEAATAALLEPYVDRGTDAGWLNWPPDRLSSFVTKVDQAGFQVHVHAIGDRAIRVTLDALESAARANGVRDRRPLIAHLQLIDPADIPRFRRIGIVPVFQPLWAYADKYITQLTAPKLGPDRMRWNYPIESVAASGATLAMGSDWSVSSVNPLEGIEVAVTRQDPDGAQPIGDPFYPQERLDLPAALAAYTIGAAYANFLERETGSLEVGKSADLLVLSADPFRVSFHEIGEITVLLTMFEGQVIHRAGL